MTLLTKFTKSYAKMNQQMLSYGWKIKKNLIKEGWYT